MNNGDIAKENGTFDHDESAQKRTFGQKVKRHYQRFWWVHIIVIVVLTLVITLPLIFVAYPHIAQSTTNKSQITFTDEIISDPKPDSVNIELHSILTIHSSYHPTLYSFPGDFYLEGRDKPFATIQIPQIKADNGSTAIAKQTYQISDMEEFTAYTEAVLGLEEYTVTLLGRGGVKQGGLPKTHVNYNKSSTVKGFNRLAGLEILSFSLLTKSLPDGANSYGEVLIPNPTFLTVDLGNVTMDLSVNGINIGNATLYNTHLKPGNNTLTIHSLSNQTAVLGILQEPRYHCGVFPVTIHGRESVYNGEVLPYFSKALQAAPMMTTLNVTKTLDDLGFGFVLGNCTK